MIFCSNVNFFKYSIPVYLVAALAMLYLSLFPCAGVWFSLRGTTYQNNSCVTLEDIGEGDDALLCMTNLSACCRPPYIKNSETKLGKWFFPNGTAVPGNGSQLNMYRTRGKMVVI